MDQLAKNIGVFSSGEGIHGVFFLINWKKWFATYFQVAASLLGIGINVCTYTEARSQNIRNMSAALLP